MQKENSVNTIKEEKCYYASFYPGEEYPLPPTLGLRLMDLQNELAQPICLLLQCDGSQDLSIINNLTCENFISNEDQFQENQSIALVIDSPGGFAKPAYQIARLLKQKCGTFTAIVPRYAKSAATLLVMGASKIYMAKHAELGPLDAQTYDAEREHIISALDTVQSLDRVRTFALESLDEMMFLLIARTRKKTQSILPHSLRFVSEIMKPLLQQLDIIEYTQMSRTLKVAEEYAKRLLEDVVGFDNSQRISAHYVEYYKEHDFFISPEEAKKTGLPIQDNSQNIEKILNDLYHEIKYNELTALGLFKELKK